MLDTVISLDLQSSVQASYGFSKDIYDQSRINAFDEHRKSKIRFRNNKLHWEQIPRANDCSKPLQEKAVNILATIVHKLRKTAVVTFNHNYLSRLTKCAKDQNVNLLKQLADILDISFHAKTIIDDKIYRNCYVIKHTALGYSIIENPKVLLAQKHFVGSRAVTPVQNLHTEETKIPSRAEFIPSLSIYKEEVFKNNRSTKSNFCKNSFFKKGEGDLRVSADAVPIMPQTKTTPRGLEAFYPLSTEDARSIRISCGREFTLVAMNEILLDMSKRVKDRWFKSKKGFLSYMTKVFTYEKRDAVKIGSESFRITGNKTEIELTIAKQEEFLSQIEYSTHVSPEWHLKKKLCSILERDKAYNMLSSFKHCHLDNDTFEIYLTKAVELTDWDKNVILQEAKASHEKCNLLKGMFVVVNSLKIIVQENKQANAHCSPASSSINNSEQSAKAGQGGVALPDNIWGTIRQALIQHHGENGAALDSSWFSKLEAKVDETTKKITLKAPSSFFRDWINSNYRQQLDVFIRQQQYSYEII